jgi:hypothetical protein
VALSKNNKNGARRERRLLKVDVTCWRLLTVTANGLYGATSERFFTEILLIVALRLLIDVGVSAVVIALEVSGSGLPAKVTVNALVIDVIGATGILRIFV